MLNKERIDAAYILIVQTGGQLIISSIIFFIKYSTYFFLGLCGSIVSTKGYLFLALVAVVLGSIAPLT